jgi:hypothetical protein
LQQPATEEHDTSTGKLVGEFIALCHDPLQNLQGWLDTNRYRRGNGHYLFARQGTGVVENDGLRQVRTNNQESQNNQRLKQEDTTTTQPSLKQHRRAPLAVFRHAAKLGTARIGDFNRSIYPFLTRVAALAVRNAAEQTTRRQDPEPEAYSYEAEAADIRARYGMAINAARHSNKPRDEIEAIIRALRYQQVVELAAMRRRRRERAQQRPKGVD